MLSFYEHQLILLSGFCVLSLIGDNYLSKRNIKDASDVDHREGIGSSVLSALTRRYLVVYAIVMGADWLQGPYVYSLYREEYRFPERIVAGLFVTGFLSAGLTAPLIGVWADQHGRKRICLAFCVTYGLACACVLFPTLPVLFFGRILGGISTSILFSAFEAWLISSANSAHLPASDLSNIMGRATLLNGFVATTAGVVSNQLVSMTSTFVSPFIASALLLALAWLVITSTWGENYGGKSGDGDIFQFRRLRQAWQIVRADPLLLTIGLTQTCFEGSMYLFVFLWVPTLQEANRASLSSTTESDLPLGYIFSSFMVSMMLGSLLYTTVVSRSASSSSIKDASTDSPLTLHAKLSSLVCAASSLALAASVRSKDERIRFWAFCAFEACVGIYYPVQGMLRSALIPNEHRATLSSLFRVPLNIFVVVSLLTGVSSARYAVLTASSLMLAFSSVMTGLVIVKRVDDM